jgi:hypothetical protein
MGGDPAPVEGGLQYPPITASDSTRSSLGLLLSSTVCTGGSEFMIGESGGFGESGEVGGVGESKGNTLNS